MTFKIAEKGNFIIFYLKMFYRADEHFTNKRKKTSF